ncbi:hypothetical protein Tco_0173855 [Tanacetum coccineum]
MAIVSAPLLNHSIPVIQTVEDVSAVLEFQPFLFSIRVVFSSRDSWHPEVDGILNMEGSSGVAAIVMLPDLIGGRGAVGGRCDVSDADRVG